MDLDGTVHARPRTSKHQDPSAHARNSRETNVDLAGRIRRGICAKRNYLSRSVFRARSLGDSCMERSLARPRLGRVVGKCNAPKKRRATSRRDVASSAWIHDVVRRTIEAGASRALREDSYTPRGRSCVWGLGERAGALSVSVPGDFEPHMEGIAAWFRARPDDDARTENAPRTENTPARRSREARRHVRRSEPRERRRATERDGRTCRAGAHMSLPLGSAFTCAAIALHRARAPHVGDRARDAKRCRVRRTASTRRRKV